MANDEHETDRKSPGRFDHIVVDYMGRLTKLVESGEYIDGPELASLLRQHGSGPIPETVLDYLCRYLEGGIDKPKGRKPLPGGYRHRRNMIIGGLYRSYLAYLEDRKRRYGHHAGWLRSEYTPAELAARIVAKRFKGYISGEESWRTVQNIASSQK